MSKRKDPVGDNTLARERRRSIFEMRQQGHPLKAVAERFGINTRRVSHIAKDENRKEQARLAALECGDAQDIPLASLDLGERVLKALERAGIATVGEVLNMISRNPAEMPYVRGLGEKSLSELADHLTEAGYILPTTETES